jgi:hypothetical protein
MSLIRSLIVFCVLGAVAFSCFDPPQYSPIPSIDFAGLKFKEVGDVSEPDSLIISLNFKDGDGDIGLDASGFPDQNIPYNNKYYFRFPNGTLLNYKAKRTNPNYDTLPAFVKPYNCINWEIFTEDKVVKDTLYFQLNPDHYNIFVDFLVKNPSGDDYKEFDWREEFAYPNCGISFDGRFPVLSKDLSQPGPLEGTIRYGMVSTGFKILFSIKTLKLRVRIQDRALNKSNIIETPAFRLSDI